MSSEPTQADAMLAAWIYSVQSVTQLKDLNMVLYGYKKVQEYGQRALEYFKGKAHQNSVNLV